MNAVDWFLQELKKREWGEKALSLAENLDRRGLELWASAELRMRERGGLEGWEAPTWREEPEKVAAWAKGGWLQRWVAALHPQAPQRALKDLAADSVPFIARLAQARLSPFPPPPPIPVRIVLAERDAGEIMILSPECENWWLRDLRELQEAVRLGRMPLQRALDFVRHLPRSWVASQLDNLLDCAEGPQEEVGARGQDPALLIAYAHELPTDGIYDTNASQAEDLLIELLWELDLDLKEPVHQAFSEEELLEWLSMGYVGGIDDLLLKAVGFYPEYAHLATFPGGSLLMVYFDGMTGGEAPFIMGTPFPEELKGWQGLGRILEAVRPGHYLLTWDWR